jgi:D-glycero-D-manno-heptose 1,7-bisphosphate phosphatase
MTSTLEFSKGGNPIINQCLKSELKPAVFLDRDGTLIEDRDYLSRPEDVTIFPGAAPALRKLRDAGFLLFIVSNQSGVGRGYFSLAEVENVNRHVIEEFARAGAHFDKIYVAPEARGMNLAWTSRGVTSLATN